MAENRLQEIRKERLEKRAAAIESGRNPYPSEAARTHTIETIIRDFKVLKEKQQPVTVCGRLMALRSHGAITFMDLQDGSGVFQVQATESDMPAEIYERISAFDVGDFVQVHGHLTTTKRQVPTISATETHLLTKSIQPLPSQWYGLKDQEKRLRHRELDLLFNESQRHVLMVRQQTISWLRNYFESHGYLEVDTPTLQPIAGGAAAKPFVTHHNALDLPLYLRIAAELHLKRLLVAGFEQVYEIGTRFRNEGIDRQHNPEFTMLESQWAYADYENYMDFTEQCLPALVNDITGGATIQWQGYEINWGSPFKRLNFTELVSEELNIDIRSQKDPDAYLKLFKTHDLSIPEATTYTKLVDELYKELIRPHIIQPTLLYDYPREMAPLAKAKTTEPDIAEKFQLVVAGFELVNAYTELNDPVIQRQLLEEQQHTQAKDEESHPLDEAYLEAMETGMPPNAGWGLGVDRLIMLLTDTANIRDTIAFPLLKPER